MSGKKEHIDVVFRNGLSNYEEKPEIDLWNDIAKSINSERRVSPVFWRVAATVASFVLIGALAFRMGVNSVNKIAVDSIQQPSTETEMVVNEPESVLLAVVEDNNTNSVAPEAKEPIKIIVVSNVVEEIIPNTEDVAEPSSPVKFESKSVILNNDLKLDDKVLYLTDQKTYTIEELNQLAYQMELENSSDDKSKKNRWSIAALASPTYYSGNSSNSSIVKNSSGEESVVSYRGGVTFAYKVNNKISVQSGVYYSSVGQRINDVLAYSGFVGHHGTKGEPVFVVSTSDGSINIDNDIYVTANDDRISSMYSVDNFDPQKAHLPLIGNSLRQTFRYLEVPFALKYKIYDKTIALNLIGGLSSNVRIGNKVFVGSGLNRQNVGKTTDMNNFILSSTVGMGVEYNISENLALNLEPTVHYYLTPLNQSASRINPYMFGLFSGLSYKF